ncbi:MAG: DUF4159 domain-containing protein [Candidatus Omnitrophica bacterium]|nr:DUF4159 domain-containing protein [Candidatus Omnitrophota bacterium]
MLKEIKKSRSYLLALIIHIAILLIVGNILIMKPSIRQAFFEGKILSTKDVNMEKAKFKPDVKVPQETASLATKEIAAPERQALSVERPSDLPSMAKVPAMAPQELKLGEPKEAVTSKPGRNTLDFSSKAKISGRGASIKGTFVFPISTYSDWDNDLTTIPNLMNELGRRTNVKVSIEHRPLDFTDKKLFFQFPIIYMNGHQNFTFTDVEVQNIREYLTRGGFMFICNDNAQGGPFQDSLFKEFKRIFPETGFQSVPLNHPIYHSFYDFKGSTLPDALYKGIPTTGYMIYYGDRMVVYYIASGDACDAWAEAEGEKWPGTRYTPNASHSFMKLSQQAPTSDRHGGAGDEGIENAFKIGINVLVYALSNVPE